MAANDPLDRAAWRLRTAEFGELRSFDDGRPIVVMEYEPGERDRVAEWIVLRNLWLNLPPHSQLLDAIDRGSGTKLLLRYAALDWNHELVRLDLTSAAVQRVAMWGVQLTDVFCTIVDDVPEREVGRFLRPHVKIDLGDSVRVAFRPAARDDAQLPPELGATWPRADAHAVMYVIGGAISELCVGWDSEAAEKLHAIVTRCLASRRADRYRSLEELRAAWAVLGYESRTGSRLAAWDMMQEGMGWLELGHAYPALHVFRMAIHLNPRSRVAKAGRARALAMLPAAVARPGERGTFAWSEVVEKGLALEAAHEHAEARLLYAAVRRDGLNDVAVDVALARCELVVGDPERAINYARAALTSESRHPEALAVAARAHLQLRRPGEALQLADEWLAVDARDAGAHYVRGRALFAVARFIEARDAFDRACELRPQMLEAMLLRREADRSVKRIAEKVGKPNPMSVDVPAHLAQLRDALVGGRVNDAIAALERAEYDDDAVAKLVHAECLAFAQRFEEAIAMYDRAATLAPGQRSKAVAGKVHALLALERAAEAIAVLDGEHGADATLVELRALALERLGLHDEAEHELGRVVAASASRSDLRVGR